MARLFVLLIGVLILSSLRNIVDGKELAKLGDFPAIVSLQYNHAHFCAGNIIDSRHVVTTAYCVFSEKRGLIRKDNFTIVAGRVDLDNLRSFYKPFLLFIHPNYERRSFSNNIAMIRIEKEFEPFTNYMEPLSIYESDPIANAKCKVAGWGMRRDDYTNFGRSHNLFKSSVTIASWQTCKDVYRECVKNGFVFCAFGEDENSDTCFGDAGGGLVCNNKLAGLISFGIDCGNPKFPGVYVMLRAYQLWIDKVVKSDSKKDQLPLPDRSNDFANTATATFSNFIIIVLLFLTF